MKLKCSELIEFNRFVMNRHKLLPIILFAASQVCAQTIFLPGDTENNIQWSVTVTPEKDLTQVPVTISLTNPGICVNSMQMFLALDENAIAPWLKDESNYFLCDFNEQRLPKDHRLVARVTSTDHPLYPEHLYVSLVSRTNDDFPLTEGRLFTFFLDISQCSIGEHTLHVYSPLCGTNENNTYLSDDINVVFEIEEDNSGISSITTPSKEATYDLLGRPIEQNSTRTIYISNGRKVILK